MTLWYLGAKVYWLMKAWSVLSSRIIFSMNVTGRVFMSTDASPPPVVSFSGLISYPFEVRSSYHSLISLYRLSPTGLMIAVSPKLRDLPWYSLILALLHAMISPLLYSTLAASPQNVPWMETFVSSKRVTVLLSLCSPVDLTVIWPIGITSVMTPMMSIKESCAGPSLTCFSVVKLNPPPWYLESSSLTSTMVAHVSKMRQKSFGIVVNFLFATLTYPDENVYTLPSWITSWNLATASLKKVAWIW